MRVNLLTDALQHSALGLQSSRTNGARAIDGNQ